MSVTYGFYDSIGGDRKYNAEQFDSIFKGIINDGIFKNIGGALKVTTPSALMLSVATGKCWFNNKWVENDATLNLTAPAAHSVYDRIDAVIVEIDSSTPKRECSIKILAGTPSSSPVRPTLKQDSVNKIWQYALAYYTVAKTATVISGLTDVRGTNQTQWITNSTIVPEFNQIISDEWVQKTYNPGEYAISENKLWKCLVANNVKPSEGSNWTQVRVDTEICKINSNLSDKGKNEILYTHTSLAPVTINIKNLNNFSLVFLSFWDYSSNTILGTTFLPASFLVNGASMNVRIPQNGGATPLICTCKGNNATSVTLTINNRTSNNQYCSLYGIK